ncbi:SRPBCC family protein [Mucilaginibacter litoreus]|uniref:SRPBCC family protein n=1 Tax=Mucilaginibacter litoreus TaxID=1048221 RepID=A0ABW3ATQ5_9SPHI
MSTFESTVTINAAPDKIYNFLADMNNHRILMPDNITNWASTTDTATFTIPNITTLSLRINERVTNTLIRIIPEEKPPFEMELNWQLSYNNEFTTISFSVTANLNMFMKMMSSTPLQKLVNDETANLIKALS